MDDCEVVRESKKRKEGEERAEWKGWKDICKDVGHSTPHTQFHRIHSLRYNIRFQRVPPLGRFGQGTLSFIFKSSTSRHEH